MSAAAVDAASNVGNWTDCDFAVNANRPTVSCTPKFAAFDTPRTCTITRYDAIDVGLLYQADNGPSRDLAPTPNLTDLSSFWLSADVGRTGRVSVSLPGTRPFRSPWGQHRDDPVPAAELAGGVSGWLPTPGENGGNRAELAILAAVHESTTARWSARGGARHEVRIVQAARGSSGRRHGHRRAGVGRDHRRR
ncbi:MAG TPA: hypothetical protein VGD48_30685, partial [Kutzneria sp.]